jgi:hypothetical protein
MKLKHILVILAAGIALIAVLLFLADLCIAVPFKRFDVTTDIMAILAGALILWQCAETWFELKPRKK